VTLGPIADHLKTNLQAFSRYFTYHIIKELDTIANGLSKEGQHAEVDLLMLEE
jgi:hypothetical protein